MIKRLKTSTGVVAGIAALALGGSAIAGAATTTPTAAPTHESTTAPDGDNVQSGSQTTPDSKGTTAGSESTSGRDDDNVRAGSQTAPDPKGTAAGSESTSESNAESSGETVATNDGPGGHADEPGNPNADTQQQGQN
jgi:hypothetical protein